MPKLSGKKTLTVSGQALGTIGLHQLGVVGDVLAYAAQVLHCRRVEGRAGECLVELVVVNH